MIGAGGQAGQGDAANLLKPALARGELRTIAATTWAEYKKYFEKDAALARRFQVVKVEEPAEDRAIIDDARDHRRCSRSTTASASSTRPSRRRSSSRTATSPAGSSPTSRSACSTRPAPGWRSARTPSRRPSRTAAAEIDHLKVEIGILEREGATGAPARRADGREASRARRRPRPSSPRSRARWEDEKALVEEIRDLPSRSRTAPRSDAASAATARADRRRPSAPGRARRQDGRASRDPGRVPADAGLRRRADHRRGRSPAGRHPRRQDARRRDPDGPRTSRRSWRSASSASRTPWRRSASGSGPRGPT